jgi:2-polyprenyl-6-methoxyphenol hydroxylase-like FAD-dependent oxidoreductase
MHLGRRAYVGLSYVEGGRVNLCGLFPGETLKGCPREELMSRALESAGLGALQRRLAVAEMVEDSLVAVAAFHPGWVQPCRKAALGDAAAAIPPFTGNGMSMAVESGALAAATLADYSLDGADWVACRDRLRRELTRSFRQRMRLAMALHPFLLHPFGQSLMVLGARSGVLPLRSVFLRLRGA